MTHNTLIFIIYILGFLVSYILLRRKWNRDFGTSWGGVIICFLVSVALSWFGIIVWVYVGGLDHLIDKIDIKLPKPPKWL